MLIIGEQIATNRQSRLEAHQTHASFYKYRRAAYRSCLEVELHVVIGCIGGG